MKIFVICPVRQQTPEQDQAIRAEVEKLEAEGHTVHWAPRDTDQTQNEMGVCVQNFKAIDSSEAVAVWWDPTSDGSKFDLGMAFAIYCLYDLPIMLLNKDAVAAAKGEFKSFEGLLLAWEDES